MNIQLVAECLGFRTAMAMVGIAIISCLMSRACPRVWMRSLMLAAVTALAANMLRIQILYWIGNHWPVVFDAAHDYLGYAAMGTALWLWTAFEKHKEDDNYD